MSASSEKKAAFLKDKNKVNLNFFLTTILKDPGQENEWEKMQFRLPKALADSCLIPELSCQFKPFPWQRFNSFHLSWEHEKVRERTLPMCTHRPDCLSRKASLLEALAGSSGMERAMYRDRHCSAAADPTHHSRQLGSSLGLSICQAPTGPCGATLADKATRNSECFWLYSVHISAWWSSKWVLPCWYHRDASPDVAKGVLLLDFVGFFCLPVSVSCERSLSPPERLERNRRDTWFTAAFIHLHLPQCAHIPHTFPKSDILLSRTTTMQQNHTQAQQKKTLSSTCNGDLCLYKLKALLLKFPLYKNGVMGMEKLQLGWSTRAICSAAGTLAGSSWAGGLLSPHWSLDAQLSFLPSPLLGQCLPTPFRPWKLQINTRRFGSFPAIFHVQENIHAYTSLYSPKELVA